MVPARRARRPYILAFLGVLALLIAVAGAVATTRHRRHTPPDTTPTPVASASTLPTLAWSASPPALPADVTVSWSWLDSTEGDLVHGGDTTAHPIDLLTIPALAQDYLGLITKLGETVSPHDVAAVHGALTGQPDKVAELGGVGGMTDLDGGTDRILKRVADVCQLPGLAEQPPALDTMDLARYAACLREPTITDASTAQWVIDQMRDNHGGIGDERGNDGAQTLAQYNSTVDAGNGRTRTGCIGIGAYWTAAVQVEYPTARGTMFGVATCAQVAGGLFPPDTQQAPDQPAPAGSSSAVVATPATTCPYGTCRGTD